DLVGAILTAAGLYRQALDEHNDRRGVRQQALGDATSATVPAEDRSVAGLLEEFAEHVGLRCPKCRGELRPREPDPDDMTPDGLDVAFTCRRCGAGSRHRLGQEELASWLLRPE